MKKHLFLYLVFTILVFFFSCKKKDNADPDPSGTPITNIVPSDSSNYYALFSCINVYSKISGSFTPTGNQTSAYYSSQLIINEAYNTANLQDIGVVNLNSIIFKNKNNITNFYYSDSTLSTFTLPLNWNISGTSAINSFSVSNTNTLPTFTASAGIQDSISIAAGFTVNIKGTADCNLIRVFILGGAGSTTFPNKLVAGTDTSIRFSAADLQGVTPTNAGYISVQLFRDNYRTISGKRMSFRTGLNYINNAFKIKL